LRISTSEYQFGKFTPNSYLGIRVSPELYCLVSASVRTAVPFAINSSRAVMLVHLEVVRIMHLLAILYWIAIGNYRKWLRIRKSSSQCTSMVHIDSVRLSLGLNVKWCPIITVNFGLVLYHRKFSSW